MVHSLFPSASEAEGDKNAKTPTNSKETIERRQHQQQAALPSTLVRNNSDGSECLFSRSTEELLDLDLELRAATTAAGNSNFEPVRHVITSSNPFHVNHNQQRSSLENGFSSDSREPKSYFQHSGKRNSPLCCPCSATNSIKRSILRCPTRASNLANRLIKMALKRYYLILACLTVVIVSCLIASFVISRSVGIESELEASNTDSNGAQSSRLGSAASSHVGQVVMEQRPIDLIDLIEFGKTFAFVKYRFFATVPKSAPLFNQRPAFLMDQDRAIAKLIANIPAEDQHVAAADTSRYHMTSVRELEAESSKLIETIAAASNESRTTVIENNNRSSESPLVLDIKPVTPASAALAPGIEDLAAILAMTASSGNKIQARNSETNNRKGAGSELDQIDPMELAASEMNLTKSSVHGRVMIDCFMVDTEKRYDQKIGLEDSFRSVASTRKVDFAHMMKAIVECRNLTWSTLPERIKIKATPVEQQALIAGSGDAAANSVEKKSQSQAQDLINSLLGNWLSRSQQRSSDKRDGFSAAKPNPETTFPFTTADVNPHQAQTGEASPSAVTSSEEAIRRQQDRTRTNSFLGIGISMVNGIVPNTLWCGLGDRAANYSELGLEYKVDACCRAHDHCPVRLKPFTADYGLINWSMSTRSHCNCDMDFNDCLSAINSTLSNVIKVLYFRFVGLQCIDVEGRQRSIDLDE